MRVVLLGARGGAGWLPLALATTLLLTACGDRRAASPGQAVAKVNRDEITVHQINHALQQQRDLRPDQADAAARQVLEKLIDQQLALQRADDLKLDRDPQVLARLEASRREVLARAYLERVGEAAVRPTPDEVRRYYAEMPALFRERRVYHLQELTIDAGPEQVAQLSERLSASKGIAEFVEHLKAKNIRFNGNQMVRPAEELPLPSLKYLAAMKDGEARIAVTPTGAQVVVLVGSRSQPVSEEQARPAIEQFILNDRKRQLAQDDLRALRAQASIEYLGAFAKPASAPSADAGPAATYR